MTDPKEKQQSRKTALVVAAVLAFLAAWNVHRGRLPLATILASIASALVMIGLLLPVVAVEFHRGWMKLAAGLGYLNSRILLTIIYYLVITPFGWVRKLLRRDPLGRRRKPARQTYWLRRTVPQQSREQFERAF